MESFKLDQSQKDKNDIKNIKVSLENITSQLDSLENANSIGKLDIMNYVDNTQNIHPKILGFSSAWNGYKYWMAYTPYPKGSVQNENPSIAVSNDKVKWVTPSGLTNPLDPYPVDGYNSDTHLLYRADTNTMEIWWRYYKTSNNTILIYRRTSTNGIDWSDKELVITKPNTSDMLSPAIIFEDGKYKIWFCRNLNVMKIESDGDTISTWGTESNLDIDWISQNLRPWHLDVIKTELGYEMIICAFDKTTGTNNTADLYYVLQKNDNTFTAPKIILKRSKNIDAIDYTSIYRSSILKENGVYYIVYSCIDKDSNRWMSISTGTNIFGLNGYNNGYNQSTGSPGSRSVVINDGTTLTNYNVESIDTIYTQTGATITVNSFIGGYNGKKITLVPIGSAAVINLNYSPRLLLPNSKSYALKYKYDTALDLICTNATTNEWRVIKNLDNTLILFDTSTNLNEYNVSGINTIVVTGTNSVLTINSLVCDKLGATINVIVASSTASVVLTYNSARLLTPGLTTVTFDKEKMGMTLVCTASDVFRAF